MAGLLVGFCAPPHSLQSQLADVTQPGDPIIPTADNGLGWQHAAFASIDGDPSNQYIAFDKIDAGFTVFPRLGLTVVCGLRLTSASGPRESDPASYALFGSSDGTNLTLISSGPVAPFTTRLQTRTIVFDNRMPYLRYKLIFPTLSNTATADYMQIGEVELLGVAGPHDATTPGDRIVANSPTNPTPEGVANAIDDQPTQYRTDDEFDAGFTVTPSRGATTLVGLTLTSGNDGPERDPASYGLEGSDDGTNFVAIRSGKLPPFLGRLQKHHVLFPEQTLAFRSYRVRFPTVANPSIAKGVTIAEVELLAHLQPLPEVRSRISNVSYAAGTASITFATISGLSYTVEHTDDPNQSATWVPLPTVISRENSETVLDPSASPVRRFYRVRVESEPATPR